jgi:hypothetical protein
MGGGIERVGVCVVGLLLVVLVLVFIIVGGMVGCQEGFLHTHESMGFFHGV